MSYFIYTDLIGSLLEPKFVDPGSTLIHVGDPYAPTWFKVDPGSTSLGSSKLLIKSV